jgi:uncharacterized DUF497 family protein
MKFEWDHRKSLANKKKHGIGFSEAVEMWKEKAFPKKGDKTI